MNVLHQSLTPQTYFVLMELLEQDYYPYLLAHRANLRSQGTITIDQSATKKILVRALKQKWVSTYKTQGRILYHLEDSGIKAVQAETERLRHAAIIGQMALGRAERSGAWSQEDVS